MTDLISGGDRVVWIQLVEIMWTKKSRGSPASTVRNRLPRAFVMTTAGGQAFVGERHQMVEWEGFVPRLVETIAHERVPTWFRDVRIAPREHCLAVTLRGSYALGMPTRPRFGYRATIPWGQTGRLLINGRFASYSGQVYTEAVYNVAAGTAARGDVFVSGNPDCVLDERVRLF